MYVCMYVYIYTHTHIFSCQTNMPRPVCVQTSSNKCFFFLSLQLSQNSSFEFRYVIRTVVFWRLRVSVLNGSHIILTHLCRSRSSREGRLQMSQSRKIGKIGKYVAEMT